ncbi:c-type cytochrome [Sinorhizobium americanum]|uniref:c-type cytochrome n=1 Tax=Sinorhizobium americanum TaxID=194963 RepID=UPI001FDA0501|nr:c-type cytochrome [Sinorhizobium americanum]
MIRARFTQEMPAEQPAPSPPQECEFGTSTIVHAADRLLNAFLWKMRPLQPQHLVLFALACGFALGSGGFSQDAAADKLYKVVDGMADARTYNGYRRYHGGCNHCHGPDGVGSTIASSLVDRPLDIENFRRVVRDGQSSSENSFMKGFADDPNFAPYIDDIYAYLQARADGALGRGRPKRQEP